MQAMQVQNLIHDLSAKKGKRPINISRSSVKTFFKRSFMLSLAYITIRRVWWAYINIPDGTESFPRAPCTRRTPID
ncbi:hypothetical protein LB506_002646 [Fusarium annulatum]|nr:hypothetical protein LB506_002646 [Fusarium annulatum]